MRVHYGQVTSLICQGRITEAQRGFMKAHYGGER